MANPRTNKPTPNKAAAAIPAEPESLMSVSTSRIVVVVVDGASVVVVVGGASVVVVVVGGA